MENSNNGSVLTGDSDEDIAKSDVGHFRENTAISGHARGSHCAVHCESSPALRLDGRSGVEKRCLYCGRNYLARADRKSSYCSQHCHHADTRDRPFRAVEKFIHQSDDETKKIRAHGLINKRIKLGYIVRPGRCEICNITARLDACHIDYDRPHVVAFACRSCHMRSHYDPTVERKLIAVAKAYGDAPSRQLSHIGSRGVTC